MGHVLDRSVTCIKVRFQIKESRKKESCVESRSPACVLDRSVTSTVIAYLSAPTRTLKVTMQRRSVLCGEKKIHTRQHNKTDKFLSIECLRNNQGLRNELGFKYLLQAGAVILGGVDVPAQLVTSIFFSWRFVTM